MYVQEKNIVYIRVSTGVLECIPHGWGMTILMLLISSSVLNLPEGQERRYS